MQLLLITSSLFGGASKSRTMAARLIEAWSSVHPLTTVHERDLDADPLPHLTAEAFNALKPGQAQLTEAQRASLARCYEEIGLLEAADVIVVAAPMYNLSIPSTLKAWIDHIVVPGRTFRYTERGPEGLLKGKKAFVVTARGGIYRGAPHLSALDFNEPYLRAILAFMGLTDVTFIHLEGQAMGADAAAAGVAIADEEIRSSLAPHELGG